MFLKSFVHVAAVTAFGTTPFVPKDQRQPLPHLPRVPLVPLPLPLPPASGLERGDPLAEKSHRRGGAERAACRLPGGSAGRAGRLEVLWEFGFPTRQLQFGWER